MKQDVFGAHWKDQSWHEVLRLICGMIDEKFAEETVDYLANDVYRPWPRKFKNRPPWNIILAIACIGELRNFRIADAIVQKIIERTFELFEYAMFSDFNLQNFIHEHMLPVILNIKGILSNGQNLTRWVYRVPRFKFKGYALQTLLDLGKMIGSLGASLDAVRDSLLNLFEEKTLYHLRVIGLSGIAHGWHTDPKTLLMVCDCAVNDPDDQVRYAAVSALAKYFRDDPQTLLLVCDRALNDSHGWVRQAAVSSLARYFRDKTQTLPLLRDCAVNDTDGGVRGEALYALAEYFSNGPETLSLVRDCAVSDIHEDARYDAVSALAKYFRDAPQTLLLVCDRALNDSHGWVRQAAVSSLARYFRDKTQTLPLLRDRAVNDIDGGV